MRIEGWEKNLDKYISETAKSDFKWGECDCLIVASDVTKILTGKDPMSKKLQHDPDTIRGKYTSEKKAYALIKKLRFDMENIFDIHFIRKPVKKMTRGDIVLDVVNNSRMFGVCINGKIFFKTKEKGFLISSPSMGAVCWDIS